MHAAHTRRRRVPTWLIGVFSAALLAGSALTVWHINSFYARSHQVGSALIHTERQAIARAQKRERTASRPAATTVPTSKTPVSRTVSAVSCKAPAAHGPVGLVEAPSIKLTAPIVQGDADGQLAVSVGHDPGSDWPGGGGTVVLDGHDVTWFHHLPDLHTGALIRVVEPCATWTYRVTGAKVVTAGSPVPNRPGLLAMVTCYPLDALYFTNHRYVLTATQIGGPGVTPRSAATSSGDYPTVSAGVPAPWSSQDSLAANPTPLGTLKVSGTPAARWSESPAPLNDAASAQSAFFAALREAQTSTAIWARFHPGLPAGRAVTVLAGQSVVGHNTPMGTSLQVTGGRVTGATVTDDVELSDGQVDSVTARFVVTSGAFRLVSWG